MITTRLDLNGGRFYEETVDSKNIMVTINLNDLDE